MGLKALLEREIIEPSTQPTATVIWLHGLGADGHDFEPVVRQLRLPEHLPVRFLFPHAPFRAVTINAGMTMRAWYDIYGIPGSGQFALEDFLESVEHLEALLENEAASGMSAERIVLVGFSQGGAVALHAGLRYGKRLAGVLALSTYMPTAGTLESERSTANRDTPVMMAHGTMDPVVPLGLALRSRQELHRLGYRVVWREYPIMHGVCPEEIADIRSWLLEVLG